MTDFVFLAKLEDLSASKPLLVHTAGRDVSICLHEGVPHAFNDVCPHQDHSLATGKQERAFITCPLHDWCFNFVTGEGESFPAVGLEKFAVEVRNGDVFGLITPERKL